MGPQSFMKPTFWVWELHYLCYVNASTEGSKPMICYCMMVLRASRTMSFQDELSLSFYPPAAFPDHLVRDHGSMRLSKTTAAPSEP